MACLVPGLLRPSVLKELYTVYSSSFGTKERIDGYCKVAKSLFDQNCGYSAQFPLFLANRVTHIRVENDSFSTGDKVEALCKISQIRSLLVPTSVPSELREADELSKKVSDRDKRQCHFVWSGVYREMGKAYSSSGNTVAAETSLGSARGYALRERPLESVDALCKIAAEEKNVNEKSARVTLEAAINNVRGVLYGSYAKVYRLVTIAELYFSFDPEKAREVLKLADAAVAEIASHQEGEIEQSQQLIQKARNKML